VQRIKKTVMQLIISGLLVALVSSCAELDTHNPGNRFQQADNLYRASMRWGEWHSLFQLMKANPNNPFSKITPLSKEYIEHLSEIQVAHIEVVNTGIVEPEKSAKTIYLIEFHPLNSSVIKKVHLSINWWYDDKLNKWFTDTPLPKEFEPPKKKTIKLSPR